MSRLVTSLIISVLVIIGFLSLSDKLEENTSKINSYPKINNSEHQTDQSEINPSLRDLDTILIKNNDLTETVISTDLKDEQQYFSRATYFKKHYSLIATSLGIDKYRQSRFFELINEISLGMGDARDALDVIRRRELADLFEQRRASLDEQERIKIQSQISVLAARRT